MPAQFRVTVMTCVVVLEPAMLVTVSSTVNCRETSLPPYWNLCVGFWALDVPPSPKSQLHAVTEQFGIVVDVFVNCTFVWRVGSGGL